LQGDARIREDFFPFNSSYIVPPSPHIQFTPGRAFFVYAEKAGAAFLKKSVVRFENLDYYFVTEDTK
jgi:hypothetical protein